MFRAPAIRTACVAARNAARLSSSQLVAGTQIARSSVVAPAARPALLSTVRFYSAASGLKKEEVEGRIMSVLQGFDKVRSLELDASRSCWP